MSDVNQLVERASDLADKAAAVSNEAINLSENIMNLKMQVKEAAQAAPVSPAEVVTSGVDPFVFAVTVFILACFVGYYVVWKVTPALHTPLMSVTNAVSSIIIIGALLAVGQVSSGDELPGLLGSAAIVLASINIFGGFIVTQRMLRMFKKKG